MDIMREGEERAVSLPSDLRVRFDTLLGPAAHYRAAHPYIAGVLLVALTTLLLQVIQGVIDPRDSLVLFLVPILLCALWYGQGVALVASVLSVVSSALFVYEPYFSIWVADRRHATYLLVFLMTALAVGRIAHEAKRTASALAARQREAEALYGFSRQLANASSPPAIHAAIREHLAAQLGERCFLVVPEANGDAPITSIDGTELPAPVLDAVRSALQGGGKGEYAAARDAVGGDTWVVKPIRPERPSVGLVVMRAPARTNDETRKQVDKALRDAVVSLERLDVDHALEASRLRANAETLREALIGSVTHELRTPLSTIVGSASILARSPDVEREPQLANLVALIGNASAQLDLKISNLIDATRISSASITPKFVWVDPTDIVSTALNDCAQQLARHRVVRSIPLEPPLIETDPMLLKEAVRQLLDNAAKYSPAGSAIEVRIRLDRDNLIIAVSDEGEGMTESEIAAACQRFVRGERQIGRTPGSGLGLWIASALAGACHSTLSLTSGGPGRGATASIAVPLPAAGAAPAEGDSSD